MEEEGKYFEGEEGLQYSRNTKKVRNMKGDMKRNEVT